MRFAVEVIDYHEGDSMSKRPRKKAQGSRGVPATSKGNEAIHQNGEPRCLDIASQGIETGTQFAGFMSSLMSDLIEGRISPQIGNATCNAGGKLLKVVELQHRYGSPTKDIIGKELRLT